MILNEKEYQASQKRLARLDEQRNQHLEKLQAMGATEEQIEEVLAPVVAVYCDIQAEIAEYERFVQGDVQGLDDFGEIGRALIAFRIAKGVTQGELANRLGVSKSHVSRDERDEYWGASIQRVGRVLDVLGVRMYCRYESGPPQSPAAEVHPSVGSENH